jgi:predicted phosphoribosyltransferase
MPTSTLFESRTDAGRKLAHELAQRKMATGVVYGLPRGGVSVAYEIAQALDMPLEVILSRKLREKGHPEHAVGALNEEDDVLLAPEYDGAQLDWLQDEITHQRAEIERQRGEFRGQRAMLTPEGRTAILVDDGLATGYTMAAAIRAVKKLNASRVVVAVPAASHFGVHGLDGLPDETIVLEESRSAFFAVGSYYEEFPQVSSEEVVNLLAYARPG